MKYQKVLIAVDSSPHALNAAKKGFELAQVLNAQVGIVSVVDVTKEVFSYDLGFLSRPSNKSMQDESNDAIEEAIRMYSGKDEIVRFMPEGFPKKEIVILAKEWGADLVVLGTHGRAGLSYVLLGSVAEYVIKHANVPVLVVPLR
jgi:nucleotide-binding universal stress UspA family protein